MDEGPIRKTHVTEELVRIRPNVSPPSSRHTPSARPRIQSQVFCSFHHAQASSASQGDIVFNHLRVRFAKLVQPSAGVERFERRRAAGNFQAMVRDALRDAAAA